MIHREAVFDTHPQAIRLRCFTGDHEFIVPSHRLRDGGSLACPHCGAPRYFPPGETFVLLCQMGRESGEFDA